MLNYSTTYLPSCRYYLPVTTMNKTELHHVQKNYIQALLNKQGYNKNYRMPLCLHRRECLDVGFLIFV